MLLKDKDFLLFNKFIDFFNLKIEKNKLDLLSKILFIFSNLPYENLTKLRKAEERDFEKRLRTPYYLIKDFFEKGTGGTCFSLVYFLKNFLEYIGFKSEFLLCDRIYGENTHTLILTEIDNKRFLCDIGYLIYKPIPLEKEIFEFENNAYDFILENKGKEIYVYTKNKKGFKKFRYKIKMEKVKEDEFISAWEKSFEFEMMNHIIITKDVGDGIIYIKDEHFHKIKKDGSFYKKLTKEEFYKFLESLNIKWQSL
ncbi:MAG: arylamine N-acetyltransferase [candidate division WOR-3 bacterium]